MRILIADDDVTCRRMLAAVLRKSGHDVVETVDGAAAWHALQQPGAPPLAILDWMMPEMDGLEVVRRVRTRPSPQPPYLIMLTAMGEKADVIAGLEAGANDYLIKPCDLGELRARVEVGHRMVALQEALAAKIEELRLALEQTKRAEAEKAHLEAQLFQSQKMESVGRLAGGVAHEFNNILMVILGYAEMAEGQIDASHPIHRNLRRIQKAAEQSANLTSQLLAFARREMVVPRVLDLNDTVAGVLRMIRRLMGEDIELIWTPGANLWPVKVDPAQIDRILVNLCLNARDAISDVGRLTLETHNTTLDNAASIEDIEATPGDYVVLVVSDTGAGMSPGVLARLFEPFFTTKEMGRGTGLGLAAVYGIIKQNGGFLGVSSQPGLGTTFRMHLPRHTGEPAAAPSPEASPAPRGRGETVLLVEDEPAVLALTASMLAPLGYTVLAAGTPEEALRLVRAHAGTIHLVLTDVVMPGMNGPELVTQVLALKPGVKRLLMSGYAADAVAPWDSTPDDAPFLPKPFTVRGLATAVRKALDRV